MKTAKELGLKKKQRKNLAKLIMFVKDKTPPPRFNMRYFFADKDKNTSHIFCDKCPKKEDYKCGTTACFLGYAIPAGLKAKNKERWDDYSSRVFGIKFRRVVDTDEEVDCKIYDLLFNEWHLNSKNAAVKRGAWFLQNGLPEADLQTWEAPRNFKPDWKAIKKIAKS